MSEKWKPESNEIYYYISESFTVKVDCNKNVPTDNERIYCGNCFRTDKEAEAAAEKVKALLLSLHDNGTSTDSETLKGTFTEYLKKCAEIQADMILQKAREHRLSEQYGNAPEETKLPKLTAEVFNRPDCPEWAKWAAVSNGVLIFADKEPTISEHGFWISADEQIKKYVILSDDCYKQFVTQKIERPAQLPDWVKTGAWAYHNERYGKITGINHTSGKIDIGETGHFIPIGECSEARLRAWTFEDAPMGLKLKDKYGEERLANINGRGYKWFYFVHAKTGVGSEKSFEELAKKYTQLDGKPCGVLEHLENGEWVH